MIDPVLLPAIVMREDEAFGFKRCENCHKLTLHVAKVFGNPPHMLVLDVHDGEMPGAFDDPTKLREHLDTVMAEGMRVAQAAAPQLPIARQQAPGSLN